MCGCVLFLVLIVDGVVLFVCVVTSLLFVFVVSSFMFASCHVFHCGLKMLSYGL